MSYWISALAEGVCYALAGESRSSFFGFMVDIPHTDRLYRELG